MYQYAVILESVLVLISSLITLHPVCALWRAEQPRYSWVGTWLRRPFRGFFESMEDGMSLQHVREGISEVRQTLDKWRSPSSVNLFFKYVIV